MKRVTVMLAGLLMLAAAADRPAPPPAGNGTLYLYFIRHGSYIAESEVDERVGNRLDEVGRTQARDIAQRLMDLPVRLDTLVSSDFTRARETADIIGGILRRGVGRDSLIRECTPESDRADLESKHPRKETDACERQLQAAWARYVKPSPGRDRHVVLVCHGNVIRWFVMRALGAPSRRWASMEIANASLTIMQVRSDGTTRLVMFNDIGHLPVAAQTWTGRGAGWGRRR